MGKSDDVRTTVSVKTLTVSSVEELNTRSMSLSACPCDLLVTVGSHEQQSISRRAPPPGRHFWSRARMGLWSGVRARFDTVSITVYRSLNAVTRGRSQNLVQHGLGRFTTGARQKSNAPRVLERFTRLTCRLDGDTEAELALVAIYSATAYAHHSGNARVIRQSRRYPDDDAQKSCTVPSTVNNHAQILQLSRVS